MPVPTDSGTFPATAKGLHAALALVESCCTAWALDPAVVPRARIAVEELFSNTIKYGYGAECEREVRLRLSTAPALTLVYEDDAPPFDPTRWRDPENAGLAPDERAEGKQGIAILLGLARTAEYRARPGGNGLILTFGP